MLTSWTGALLCDKSDHSQRKAPPNSPSLVMNEKPQSPWSMGVCYKPIRLHCAQRPLLSVGLCRNVFAPVCTSKKNECRKVITCLKWWPNYDSLLQHAAVQNQTPWNWLPTHLDLICDYFSAGPLSLTLCWALLISHQIQYKMLWRCMHIDYPDIKF